MVSWHVLACLVSDNASSGALPCFCHVCSNISDRRCAAMFLSCLLKHLWQAVYWHALAGLIFENASGGPLPCLCPVYSNASARWYTDMFWHVGCLKMLRSSTDMFVACFFKHLCQVLYWVADRTRQDHAKIQKKGWRVCLFWNASPWIKSRWQPSPDNHHPTCHGGDHSK